ncbi:MAG: DUF4243 domain-containing protein [Saccharospirillaceae bacterium]|nr:questin oxidase family protein [Pseudomonadales bacterium]NRB78727.1 DUF4243 domain-containing protein [Saccharospirillaceae bacterium]
MNNYQIDVNSHLTENHNFQTNNLYSTLVNTQLKQDSFYHPNIGGRTQHGMANHFPMTIQSMANIGANDQQILDFMARWQQPRSLILQDNQLKDNLLINEKNWFEFIGKAHYLIQFKRVFFDKLEKENSIENTQKVILESLDKMKYGIAMGLFHPFIRLSFAIQHQDNGLIADALAYMAIRYKDLYNKQSIELDTQKDNEFTNKNENEISSQQIWDDFLSAINKTKFSTITQFIDQSRSGTIHICERLCAFDVLHDLSLNLPLSSSLSSSLSSGYTINNFNLKTRLQEITELAGQLFLTEESLTTIHAVTATQALSYIVKVLYDKNTNNQVLVDLTKLTWVWLSSLYIEKTRHQNLFSVSEADNNKVKNISWAQIKQQALNSKEVHVIKLTFSCEWLDNEYKNNTGSTNSIYKTCALKSVSRW